jgi:hypothetical protein
MIASKVYSKKERIDIKVSKFRLELNNIPEKDKVKSREFIKRVYPKAVKVEEIGNTIIAYGKHNETDDDKLGEPCSLRQSGKVLNFFISFGGSAFTLSASQGISMKEAEELLNGFWEGFPELKIYFETEKTQGTVKGYNLINNITKGRRYYPEHRDYVIGANKIRAWIKELGQTKYKTLSYQKGTEQYRTRVAVKKLKGEIERASMNTGIQGTAADMTKTSAILIMEKLEEDGFNLIGPIRPVNMVHDEHLFENEKKYSEYLVNVMEEQMEAASFIFIGAIIPASPYNAKQWVH